MPLSSDTTHSDKSYTALAAIAFGLITILAVLMIFPDAGRPGLGTPAPSASAQPPSGEAPHETVTQSSSAPATSASTQTAKPPLGATTPSATPTSGTATGAPTRTPTPKPTATATRSSTATQSATPRIETPLPTATASQTPLPNASAEPLSGTPAAAEATPTETSAATQGTPTAVQIVATPITAQLVSETHDWLRRPVGEAHWQSGSIFYPFASTGHGQYLLHHGIDMGNPLNTPVLAAADGEIVFAGTDDVQTVGPTPDFYGKTIIIKADRDLDGQAVYCLYGHLNLVEVAVGKRIAAGEPIGAVGMTGIAIGPHLHFEIRLGVNDYAHSTNPDLWMEPLPGLGTIAGRAIDSQGNFLDEHLIAVYQASAPDKLWREALTYIRQEGLGPDPILKENFVLADVYAGDYILKTKIEGQWLTAHATLRAGQTIFVDFKP